MDLTDNTGKLQSDVQTISHLETNTDSSQISQEGKAICEIKNPFKLSERKRQNDFQVEFNNSLSTNPSQTTTDSIKHKIIPFKKKKGKFLDSAFSVSFNESPNFSPTSVASNLPKKKVLPFKGKKKNKKKDRSFKVGFEESVNTNTTKTPDSADKKTTIFQRKKDLTEDAFHVGYMESSISTINEISPHCFDNQILPFKNNDKSKENGFNIDFEDTENAGVSDLSLSPDVKSVPFPKVSKINNFNVSFNESAAKDSTENNTLNALSTGNKIANSIIARNDSMNKSSKINFSCSKSLLNKTGDISLNKTSDTPNLSHIGLDQSSYNDENLNGYISDHSDENSEENANFENLVAPTSLKAAEDPVETSHEEENREKILELKLKAIVENASKLAKTEETIIDVKPSREPSIKKIASSGRRLQKPKLKKPAPYATRRLYHYLIGKLKPKYGIDSALRAEEIVINICETVKIVIRRKPYQKKLIHDLKVEMAKAGLIECTYDFYDFVREFLPYEFREKVIPCIQPITNIVYPPKDAKNPFDKIL